MENETTTLARPCGCTGLLSTSFTKIVDAKGVPVSVKQSRGDSEFEWTIEVRAPVTIPSNSELGFVLRKTDREALSTLKNVTINISKWKNWQSLQLEITGLGSLGGLYKRQRSVAFVDLEMKFGWWKLALPDRGVPIHETGVATEEVQESDQSYRDLIKAKVLHKSKLSSLAVSVKWEFYPGKNSQGYLSRTAKARLSQEIQEIEGLVSLRAANGKVVKFYKGMLAACSPKYLAEFGRSGMTETRRSSSDDGGIPVYAHCNKMLDENGLAAFVQFVASFSVESPISSAPIALQLLMAGHYNLIPELVSSMTTILLGQPPSWFDTDTSVWLYGYATEIHDSLGEEDESKPDWRRLIIKALWTLKGKTMEELQTCSGTSEYFPTHISLKIFAKSLTLF